MAPPLSKKDTSVKVHLDKANPEDSKGPRRKRARVLGTYACPDCDKVFTRSDHLGRHHLNHKPKEVFECAFMIRDVGGATRKCGRKFVRKDLKERHMKRHDEESFRSKEGHTTGSGGKLMDGSKIPGVYTGVKQEQGPFISPSMSLTIHLANSGAILGSLHSPGSHMNGDGPDSAAESAALLPQQHGHGHSQHQTPLSQHHLSPQNIHGHRNLQTHHSDTNSHHLSSHPNPPIHNAQPPMGLQAVDSPIDMLSQLFSRPSATNLFPANFLGLGATHSQNDIILWLFTDSPPNPLLQNGGGDSLRLPPVYNRPTDGIGSMNAPGNGHGTGNGNHNPLLQNLANFPPVSPSITTSVPDHSPGVPIQSVASNQGLILGGNTPVAPITGQLIHELSPLYHNRALDQQLVNAYGMADVNVFSNSGNPLDEIFLKLIPDNNMVSPLLLGNVNFNVGSTALLSSPAISTDSASTPKEERLKRDAITIQERLGEFVSRLNSPKNKHIYLDAIIVNECIGALQSVSRENLMQIFEDDGETSLFITFEDRLLYYLHLYWAVFHPQFSMLHRPSFDTQRCEPLLILAMIIVGCQYSEFPKHPKRKSAEFKLALKIATPLRFMIFQHEDFRLPVRVWVLQALITLEWVEKNFLLRDMHERAHVHHGTTAQLLRRLPLLGGNPASKLRKRNGINSTEDDSDLQTEPNGNLVKGKENAARQEENSDSSLFEKWVESELMKRVTFMTFYVDVMDYVKFRHNPQIVFAQLQLLHLPCNDENLWELTEVNGSFKKVVKRQKKLQHQLNTNTRFAGIKPGDSFLSALKKLLKRTGDYLPKSGVLQFTRKVLFAGLVLLMYQIQLQELQNTLALIAEKHDKSAQWKDILTQAFDNWNIRINENCCMKPNKLGRLLLPPKVYTLQCQFPIYHLTQIIGLLELNHYDIAIFGGSPANMSVDATTKDHIIVQAKLNSMWLRYAVQKKRTINDIVNLKSVFHLFLLLWETVLAPAEVNLVNGVQGTLTSLLLLLPLGLLTSFSGQEFLDWNAEPDYFDLMYALAVATLTVWLFVFTTCGLELQSYVDRLERCESYLELVDYLRENGYTYLQRIRLEFRKYLNNEGFGSDYLVQPFSGKIPPHEVQLKYIEMLPRLTDKQNVSGICFLVGTHLLNSQWEILRENAKLILNCGLRSIGKKTIICQNLFDNEWD